MKDERLSPMTYKKLKEKGYSQEDWKNLTQEQANKIVQEGQESTSKTSNSAQQVAQPTTKENSQSSIKLVKPDYIGKYHSSGDVELNYEDTYISKEAYSKVAKRVSNELENIKAVLVDKEERYESQYQEANALWSYFFTTKFIKGLKDYKDAPVSVEPVGNDVIVWNAQPDVRYGFRNAELRTPDEEYQISSSDDSDNIAENNKTLKTNTINLINKWLSSDIKRNGITVNVFMSTKKNKQALQQAIGHNNTKGYLPVTVTKKPRNKQIEIRVGRYTSKVPIDQPNQVLSEIKKGFELKNL